MPTRTVHAVIVTLLFFSTLSAATDPFVGKWKLNQAKSSMTGEQVKIEDLGGNKFRFTDGDIIDTLVANGTDQSVHFGRTQSLTLQSANTWKVVTKKDGRTIATNILTLSPDGKTAEMALTGTRPDGSTFNNHVTFKRIAGTSGFAGTWESTSLKLNSPAAFVIEAYQGDGLSFIMPAEKDTLRMKFDGKDYMESGPNVPAGSTTCGRRTSANALDLTDKVKGKVVDTWQLKAAGDGKTLTMTVQDVGQKKPLAFVYDRQ